MLIDTCEILVVRHGETVANKSGILQGHYDTPLNENGIAQAKCVAKRLKNKHFDAIYSSDLNRAFDTAKIIAEEHVSLPIIKVEKLREWNLGVLQGRPYKELIIEYPDILAAFKQQQHVPSIPGGETIEEFHNRIANCLEDIAKENLGKKVLIVSHGGAIQRMLIHTMGRISEKNIYPLCDNVGISVFKYQQGHWQMVKWNDTAHVEELELHTTLTF